MKFTRFLTGIAAAAIVASMATMSVSAADYANPPSYPGTVSPSTSSSDVGGTSDSSSSKDTAVKVVTDASVKDALKGNATVKVDAGKATIKEDAIGAIAAQDKPVTFDAGDYTVTIDPAKITDVKAINVAMDIEADSDSITITPAAKGEFGMTLEVTIPAKKLGNVDVKKAHLFYVDDDGNVTDLGKVKVNSNGSVTVALTHASYYVITDEDLADEADDTDDSDDSNDDAVIDNGDDDVTGDDVIVAPGDDANPGTGVGLVFGAAVVSAAAVALTSKKRK